jgi:hypothetical protein
MAPTSALYASYLDLGVEKIIRFRTPHTALTTACKYKRQSNSLSDPADDGAVRHMGKSGRGDGHQVPMSPGRRSHVAPTKRHRLICVETAVAVRTVMHHDGRRLANAHPTARPSAACHASQRPERAL